MSAAERVYGLLLRAYPQSFRAAYGAQMAQLFRDQLDGQRRSTRAGDSSNATLLDAIGFWTAVLSDLLRSAPALRLDALRAGRRARNHGPWDHGPHLHPGRDIMNAKRTVAVLATLGGVFEIINTGVEAGAGWGAQQGAGWTLAVAFGFLMGALLLAAGVASLRRDRGPDRLAFGAAIACLALVIGIQLVFPFMSIFSRLLGVAIPLALLAAGRRSGAGPTAHSAA